MVLVRRRAVLLVALAVLAVFGLTRLGGGASGIRQPPAARPILVTVPAGALGRRVPFGFLGLSLEYSAIEPYAGTDPSALDPVFEQLARNLVPGQAPVLRIGGDSTDRTWWPAPGLEQPPGVRFAITDRWLAVARGLRRALRARLIVGLNLEADSPELAAAEAGALIDGIGRGAIRAFELGNEPDLYASFPWYRAADGRHVTGRPPLYDMSGLIADFSSFSAALPRLTLAGPSLGAPGWTRQLGRFLAAEPRIGLVTLHRYPLQLCYTPRGSPRYPTLRRLLSPAASIGLADSFARYATVARTRGRALRIDELNSVSCGADSAISKTFASALWALDTLFEMARVGIHGVNIHTFPGAGYELFRISHPGGRWRASVAPEYYGLMLFARAAPAGSRLLGVQNAVSGSVRIWATRARDGTIRVLAVNMGARARVLSVRVTGAASGRASVERLTAPSPRSRGGVTLGGQSFGSGTFTGRLTGRLRASSVSPVDGRYTVALPAASAVLLVISPRGRGST
jgi:hypothetical protein